MPANKRLKQSNHSYFYSQIDILIQIFSLLDAPEIAKISKCCRLWFNLVKSYESILYREMTIRKFQLSPEDLKNRSWKNLYRIHLNYAQNKYGFVRGETSFKINSNFQVGSWDAPNPSLKTPLAVWPVESLKAYLVALEGDLVCWLDIADLSSILVARWNSLENFVIKHERKLEGHSSQISLLLSNGSMQLLSFDDQSLVYIWCLKTFKLQRRIDTTSALESIISMNVCKNRLVAGGMNGKVVVWDIDTGLELMSIQTNASFGSPLNVGVRDDILVYGLPSGKYVVYKGTEKVYDLDLVQASKKMEEESKSVSATEPKSPEPEQLLDHFTTAYLSSIPMKKAADLEITGTSLNTSAASTTINSPAAQPLQEHEVLMEEPFNIIPRTLALNSHVLVTNGATPNSIITWDLNTGTHLHTLSETHAASRHPIFIPDLTAEIQLAEMTSDGSLIFASVEHELDNRILVWDFDMGINKRELEVYKVQLETRAEESLFIWVFATES